MLVLDAGHHGVEGARRGSGSAGAELRNERNEPVGLEGWKSLTGWVSQSPREPPCRLALNTALLQLTGECRERWGKPRTPQPGHLGLYPALPLTWVSPWELTNPLLPQFPPW